MSGQQTPPGWYHAEGDPAGSTRWWDGSQWVGEPQVTQATDFGNVPQDPAVPPQNFGAPPQNFGAPPQNFGAPPQSFGVPPQAGQYGSAAALQPISAGSRIGGRILDWIVWFVLFIVASIPIIGSVFSQFFDAIEDVESGGELTVEEPSLILTIVTGLVALALVVAYETYGNLKGGTVGKRATSSQVVKADGSPLDLETSFRRMLPYIALSLLGLIPAVGDSGFLNLAWLAIGIAALVMLFADSRNQTPWDKLAGTIVVPKNRY